MLQMIVDRFDEAISQFLNLFFQIVPLVFAYPTGRVLFFRFIQCRAPIAPHPHPCFFSHFA
jgi:hypothetical protein